MKQYDDVEDLIEVLNKKIKRPVTRFEIELLFPDVSRVALLRKIKSLEKMKVLKKIEYAPKKQEEKQIRVPMYKIV